MRRDRRLAALALLLIQTQLLCSCAAYHAWRKCGVAGCPSDAQITAGVRSLLSQHPELGPPNEVYVQTVDRVVYLSGEVATGLQRDTAEAVARRAPGERRVVNTIALEYNGL
jgi:osmotically-inducible protein OsmY